MKVSLFQRRCFGGISIEGVTQNLAKNLPKEVTVKIYTPSYPSTGILNRVRSSLEAIKQQGDVNHITGDSYFLSYFLTKRKTILTIHDCERLISDDYSFLKKQIYKFFWFTLPALRCQYVTVVSEETRNNLEKYAGIKKDRTCVIYNGIDREFGALDLSMEEKNKILQNGDNKKTILHISDERSCKNVIRLIEALKESDFKFIKVGGMSKEQLALLEKHKIDHMQLEDIDSAFLNKIYNSVDCLVFPSLVEGFGLPVVEAQRCGCPVVTSKISSLPEIAGESACFVDPYSSDDIRRGIEEVLYNSDQRRMLVSKGFENVKRFEWKKIAGQYYELYKEVCRSN